MPFWGNAITRLSCIKLNTLAIKNAIKNKKIVFCITSQENINPPKVSKSACSIVEIKIVMNGEIIIDKIKPKITARTLTISISNKINVEKPFRLHPKIMYVLASSFWAIKKLFT